MIKYGNPRKNQLEYSPDYFPPHDYCTTADMADGQPLPPYYENGVPWRVVMRVGGHTVWVRP